MQQLDRQPDLRCATLPSTPPTHPPCRCMQALTSGGGKAEAFSSAIASAVASGGCGSVANVLSQAEASAQSSGKGQAFSEALASASAEAAGCIKKLPLCSTKGLAAQSCCTPGWVPWGPQQTAVCRLWLALCRQVLLCLLR